MPRSMARLMFTDIAYLIIYITTMADMLRAEHGAKPDPEGKPSALYAEGSVTTWQRSGTSPKTTTAHTSYIRTLSFRPIYI